jgi:hypothetical protein
MEVHKAAIKRSKETKGPDLQRAFSVSLEANGYCIAQTQGNH